MPWNRLDQGPENNIHDITMQKKFQRCTLWARRGAKEGDFSQRELEPKKNNSDVKHKNTSDTQQNSKIAWLSALGPSKPIFSHLKLANGEAFFFKNSP